MTVEKSRVSVGMAGALLLIGPPYAGVIAGADQASRAQILIKDFEFSPMSLTVNAGTTVVWANGDDEPHTVTSDSGLFRSGAIAAHGTFSFRFDRSGTYHFICSIHPQMVGTVVAK